MPRKKNPETSDQQGARFRKDARELIKSGELDPDAGEAATDALVRRAAKESKDG
jgi:polyhydroxyalkanoate synthesis regulator phasin